MCKRVLFMVRRKVGTSHPELTPLVSSVLSALDILGSPLVVISSNVGGNGRLSYVYFGVQDHGMMAP